MLILAIDCTAARSFVKVMSSLDKAVLSLLKVAFGEDALTPER